MRLRFYFVITAFLAVLLTGCMKPHLLNRSNLVTPTIVKVIPSMGVSEKATEIAIFGKGFVEGAQIKVGSRDCENVQYVSENSIYCTAPPQPSSLVTMKVINPNLSSHELPNSYAYVDPLGPVSGYAISAGSGVIRGSNQHILTHTIGEGGRPVVVRSSKHTMVVGSEAIKLNGAH